MSLFEVPLTYRSLREGADKPKWTRHQGDPISCDICTRAMAGSHQAEMPLQPAMWIMDDGRFRLYVCKRHALAAWGY